MALPRNIGFKECKWLWGHDPISSPVLFNAFFLVSRIFYAPNIGRYIKKKKKVLLNFPLAAAAFFLSISVTLFRVCRLFPLYWNRINICILIIHIWVSEYYTYERAAREINQMKQLQRTSDAATGNEPFKWICSSFHLTRSFSSWAHGF